MKGRLQNVLPVGQRHMPDPVSNEFALIPHPLDQMIWCLQGDVLSTLAPGTLKDIGRMPRDRFEELKNIDQRLCHWNQVILPCRIPTLHPPGGNSPDFLDPINL